jgi:hypothetical protein
MAHVEVELDPGSFVVDAIVKGPRKDGKYLVSWRGYEGQDTWEPVDHLHPDLVQSYLNQIPK